MNKLKLIPYIYARDIPDDIEDKEFVNKVSTHYQDDIAHINWEDEEDFPKFKIWLIEEYGEEVKQYKHFAIQST